MAYNWYKSFLAMSRYCPRRDIFHLINFIVGILWPNRYSASSGTRKQQVNQFIDIESKNGYKT